MWVVIPLILVVVVVGLIFFAKVLRR